jgi:hypothetical protein
MSRPYHQNCISILIVQSLTPSLQSMKRDSVTSASTLAEDDFSYLKQRRHSEISRNFMARSHEWPERKHSYSNAKHLLERTNSAGSLKISLYRDVSKNSKDQNLFSKICLFVSSLQLIFNNLFKPKMIVMLFLKKTYFRIREKIRIHLNLKMTTVSLKTKI